MKKITKALSGVLIGFINIVVGACGGIIAVESLKKENLNQTEAHATAIAVMLPLTLISTGLYLFRGTVKLSDSYIYIIPSLVGAIIGSWLLPKIPKKILSKLFSVFIIYAGVRMILK